MAASTAEKLPKEHGCFFRDNKRRADYALVIKKTTDALRLYIMHLERLGLEMEVRRIPVNCVKLIILDAKSDKFFIIVHIPDTEMREYSVIFDIGYYIPRVYPRRRSRCLKWLEPNVKTPRKKIGEFTSKERIAVINILLETKFGDEPHEHGLKKLLKQQVIVDAYPLHDGPAETPSELLPDNERRLLFIHWASFRCWYKEVPLDLVQRYFGCEIAFYFAWVEFFTKMLLPVAILGLLVFIINIIIINVIDKRRISDICEADEMYVCPICVRPKKCKFSTISNHCLAAKGNFIFDNYFTVSYAILMSFWATIFLNLWKRKQNFLKIKWGLEYDSEEVEVRQGYYEKLKKRNLKPRDEDLLPFLPRWITCMRLVVTISVCMLLIFLVIVAVFTVMCLKIIVQAEAATGQIDFFRRHAKSVAMVFGCALQVIFIKLFGTMYGKLSIWLTTFENPRTKKGYDNSVLYKRYFLAFANNYAPLFYMAFLKGRFYSIPYATGFTRLLETDTCQPTNCIASLSLQLAFLMVLKKFVGNILTLIWLTIQTMRRRGGIGKKDLSHYEADYVLLPTNRYLLTTEFCEMIIEFGLVTFFVAAFPLAPLCALLNNLLEQRLDAQKLVTKYRRPLPRKVSGIGAWDGVLQGVTYLSVVTNAFVIGFTSDFVSRQFHRTHSSYVLVGFINTTLSVYNTSEYDLFANIENRPDICYYRDRRHPPDHPQKYQLTTEYWIDIALRLICIFVFEHIILIANGILSHAIPKMPKVVKEQLNLDRYVAKQAKLKTIGGATRKTGEKKEVEEASSWILL